MDLANLVSVYCKHGIVNRAATFIARLAGHHFQLHSTRRLTA
jgi:rhodanese-related sulfurtransferase